MRCGSSGWTFESLSPTWGTDAPSGQTSRHTDRHTNIPQWIPVGQVRPRSTLCIDFLFTFSFSSCVSPSSPFPSHSKNKVSLCLIPKANRNGISPASAIKCRMTSGPCEAELLHLQALSLSGVTGYQTLAKAKEINVMQRNCSGKEIWRKIWNLKALLPVTRVEIIVVLKYFNYY